MTEMTLDNVEHFVGKSLGTSDWIEVDQSRIDNLPNEPATDSGST